MTAGQRVSDIIRVSNTLAAGPVEIAPAAKVKTSQILCFALPLFSYIMLCFALALFSYIMLWLYSHILCCALFSYIMLCFALALFSYIMLCFALAIFCDVILDQVLHFHLIPPLLYLLYI